MAANDHNAIGPALGYAFQFDRATYRLLTAASDAISVGFEDLDDVTVHSVGTTIREQGKSSIGAATALTDLSVALWKTLSIWASAMSANANLVDATEFHLVTTGEISASGLAMAIHAAKTTDECGVVADQLLASASSVRDDLVPYAERIISIGREQLARLVSKIFVFDKTAPRFGGSLDDVAPLRFYTPKQREAIFDRAAGWVKRRIRERAEQGEPALLNCAEFTKEVRGFVREVNIAPLGSLVAAPPEGVNVSAYRARGFVQQLDWIDLDESVIREAVIQYLQAYDTRASWTEEGLLSEETLRQYEQDLEGRWNRHKRTVERRQYPSPEHKGQELYDGTMGEDTMLANEHMPRAFTNGSFHALADFESGDQDSPRIGWHPDYKGKSGGGVGGKK